MLIKNMKIPFNKPYLTGKELESMVKLWVPKIENISEIKGQIGCKGKFKGYVEGAIIGPLK